ncbi:class I SAM-dependent methyltransferase [Nonomuraea sp. NPDC050663]|uniref:class I SAM-dependent methyltransferase n=1 Tax=Nonomuraea sp. NPDC050663 TaxID=3364370 RepID=UPI0037A57EBD
MISDADVAALYDVLNPWDTDRRADSAHYTAMVMDARSVLDVGCGTGAMLHDARRRGHAGRLVGIDPDRHAMELARRRDDIEWVDGVAAEATAWRGEFELVTMTSNAFMCLIADDEVRASLSAIHGALEPGGRLAFETRHIQSEEWKEWHSGNAEEVVDGTGRRLRVSHSVESAVDGVVTMTETTSEADGTAERVDRGVLRFFDEPELREFLEGAGFEVERLHGDFRGGPVTPASRVMVVVARSQT